MSNVSPKKSLCIILCADVSIFLQHMLLYVSVCVCARNNACIEKWCSRTPKSITCDINTDASPFQSSSTSHQWPGWVVTLAGSWSTLRLVLEAILAWLFAHKIFGEVLHHLQTFAQQELLLQPHWDAGFAQEVTLGLFLYLSVTALTSPFLSLNKAYIWQLKLLELLYTLSDYFISFHI